MPKRRSLRKNKLHSWNQTIQDDPELQHMMEYHQIMNETTEDSVIDANVVNARKQSQYKQRLLSGEKELADKLRSLVEPRRKQADTKEEQAACLQELGELYLKAGVESKNGKDFTKAAALFNAALVRTFNEEVQKKIKRHLVIVRQEFLTAFYPGAKFNMVEQWEEIRMQNIRSLEKVRTNIRDNSRSIKLLMDKYDIDAKNVLEIETCLVNEAKKLTVLVQEEMLEFIRLLWNQSMEFSNAMSPCRYSMMGLGSLARQEVTPYSDLEFAILVDERSDDVQRYFENLTNLFHLSVLDLGETPIPQMSIPSLNDFMTLGGDWFFDKITPSGFKLDGEMPWASKTPTGRQATFNKSALSLIKTPVEMAELLKDDSVLGQSYRVAEVLSRTIHIIGDLHLYGIYQKELNQISHVSGTNLVTGRKRIIYDIRAAMTREKQFENAKITFYRLPSTFVENMRLWLTPSFPGGSQWCVIEQLAKMKKLSKEDAFELKVVIALAYGMRLLTYFNNRGQCEKLKKDQFITNPGMRSILIKLKTHLLPIIHRTLHPKFGKTLSSIMHKSTQAQFNMDGIPDVDSRAKILLLLGDSRRTDPINHLFLLKCYLGFYPDLACVDQGIRGLPCGDTCQCITILNLYFKRPLDIDDLYFLLKNTNVCFCVSMVKDYLKVYEYCIQRFFKLPTGPPDIYLNRTFEKLSSSPMNSDKLFLNFDLLRLAYFSTDVTTLKHVAKSVEEFLNTEVPMWPKRMLHKGIFNVMEFDFYWWLTHVYEFLGEDEKLTNLLEKWVNILETNNSGGEFDIDYIGIYMDLGKALLQKPEKEEEAIRLYKKALQRLENDVNSKSPEGLYEQALAVSVLTFAEMLSNKRRFGESEALVKEYFFNENKSLKFTKGCVIVALKVLAQSCMFRERWVECTEVCNKIYRLVQDGGGISDYLYATDRTMIGNILLRMYSSCGNIIDLPKAAEFHKLACIIQKDKKLVGVEHKIFLLTSSLRLFADGFNFIGIQYVIQALALDQMAHTKELDFSRTDMWLHILVVLCDALDAYRSPTEIEFLFENYDDISLWMRKLSEMYRTRLDLYQVYVDYRLWHCLFSIAMDPETSFVLKRKETTGYLYQTHTRLVKYFPKCATAIKWCTYVNLGMNPNAENIALQGYSKPNTLFCRVRIKAYKKKNGRPVVNIDRYLRKIFALY